MASIGTYKHYILWLKVEPLYSTINGENVCLKLNTKQFMKAFTVYKFNILEILIRLSMIVN